METLIVTVKDERELQFVSDMLKKMRISSKRISNEEREDFGMTKLMQQSDRSEKVSRDQVIAKLRGK